MNEKTNCNDDILCSRAIILGKYILENKATVRSCAEHFSEEYGISKSTVHKDVTKKLEILDRNLYNEVKKILETNKKERHIRGGMATKKKYENMKKLLNNKLSQLDRNLK